MIRVVIYLLIVGLLAAAAVWLADRPGDVLITWLGRKIETSVMALAVAVAALAVLTTMLWSIIRTIWRSPETLRFYLRMRRGMRGYHAVSQGLIAVGSGDVRSARRFAEEAARIAPNEPLTLLLGAQASQLSGDRDAAERTFHAMASRDDTRLLGLHGLYIEAQRRSDGAAAKLYAEEAASAARAPAWAALAVFDARCAASDWVGALERLDRNMKSGLVDRESYRRLRAVLLTARALESDAHDDRDGARSLALEAVKFAPTLVPAAALAGRLLGEAGERRRAARVVETAWNANPHPDLAEAYAHLQSGGSARDRLARVEALAKSSPGNIEGALAVARAALDAQEFAVARRALTPLSIAPSRRVSMLMAELEQKEHGDEGRAREWMTRAARARARSDLDRRRPDVRPLDAGVAGDRPARCVPVEGPGRRSRRRRGADRARARAARGQCAGAGIAAAAAGTVTGVRAQAVRLEAGRRHARRSAAGTERRARPCAHRARGRADRSADPCARRSRPGPAAAARAGHGYLIVAVERQLAQAARAVQVGRQLVARHGAKR